MTQENLVNQPKNKSVFGISAKVDDKAEKYAKKFNVSKEYVMSLYMSNMNQLQDEKKALLSTYGDLLYESGRDVYYTYILNDEGPIDMFELMRQSVTRVLEHGNEEEIDKVYADEKAWEDGTVLDYRKTVFGRPNENKGQPLTGSSWQRTIWCIVADNESFEGAKLVEITSSGDTAKNLDIVPGFAYYKAFINPSKKNPNRFSFGKTSAFKPWIPKVSNAEIANRIPVIDIGPDLEEEYKKYFAGKKYPRHVTAIRGYVTWMSLDVVRGTRQLIITDGDTEESIKCNLPESIPVTYQKVDEIIAFTRLFARRNGKIGAEIRAYMVV